MESSDLAQLVAAAPHLSGDRLANLTSRFVSVPSVNGEHPERDLALLIDDELGSCGYETTLIGAEARPSLAVIGGGDARVLLNGHLDTVPVDDADQWRFEPYAGVVAEGAVHGRGACDMKGGLAIQVAVAQWLAAESLGEGLVLHFAMGEERGEPGTESLIGAGFTAPIGIVLEPTELRLGVAQRGLMTIRITLHGRAGHASRPDLTDNPIERLPAVLGAIERLQRNPTSRHALLGAPNWTATVIHSGVIPSMVPGQCQVLVDRRMIPGETVHSVLESMSRALMKTLPDDDFTLAVADEEGVYEPAEIPSDCAAVKFMSQSLQMFGDDVDLFGTPYSSDVRHLINSAGIEAVTFGPGRFSEMHARDEFINVDDLVRGARSVAAFSALALTAST
ncbi:MAG: M20/M25/M40 family metallo-hydrolase [Actinomycetota bacterium]|nr:M20/M25/M40 family metallo-hydrolase [Actinomycetota bacterium]